jgi:hypothetical protein
MGVSFQVHNTIVMKTARRVGATGQLICLDIQKDMLQALHIRLHEAGAASVSLLNGPLDTCLKDAMTANMTTARIFRKPVRWEYILRGLFKRSVAVFTIKN